MGSGLMAANKTSSPVRAVWLPQPCARSFMGAAPRKPFRRQEPPVVSRHKHSLALGRLLHMPLAHALAGLLPRSRGLGCMNPTAFGEADQSRSPSCGLLLHGLRQNHEIHGHGKRQTRCIRGAPGLLPPHRLSHVQTGQGLLSASRSGSGRRAPMGLAPTGPGCSEATWPLCGGAGLACRCFVALRTDPWQPRAHRSPRGLSSASLADPAVLLR